MLRATLQEAVPIQVLAADGRTDLFARARLYSNGTLLTTIPLTHLADGLYGSTYTPTAEGWLSAIYQLFEDAGYTIPSNYDLESETIEVSSDKTNILRILGLVHANTVFDQHVYDGGGNLVSGRLRQYDTKANALLAGATGLLFTYAISAAYTNSQLTYYRITTEP